MVAIVHGLASLCQAMASDRSTLARSEAALRHWSNPFNYNRDWAQRAKFAARMIQPGDWVCDLGCGPQALRWFLPRSTKYLPADLKRWTEDTEICDINCGVVPHRSLELCDLCVMLGVLTYLHDPEALFRELGRTVERTLISHFDTTEEKEVNQLWGRPTSLEQLETMLQATGFRVLERVSYRSWTILRATNEHFDADARQRRAVARNTFQPRSWSLRDEWNRAIWRMRIRDSAS
jgi:hypothetical protein